MNGPRGEGDGDAELLRAESARGVPATADGCSAASALRGAIGFSDGIPANLSEGPGAHTPAGSGTAFTGAILALPPDAVDAALPTVLGRRGVGLLNTLALPASSGKAGGEAPAEAGGAWYRGVALPAAVLPASLPPCHDPAGGHDAALGSSILSGISAPRGENLLTTELIVGGPRALAPQRGVVDLAPAGATSLRAERRSRLGSRLLLVQSRGVRLLARPAAATSRPALAGATHSGCRDPLRLEVQL